MLSFSEMLFFILFFKSERKGRVCSCFCFYFEEHLLAFVSQTAKSTTIKFSASSEQENGDFLNLAHLNNIRGKLNDALKIVIYADDNIFLATKWATWNR